MNTYFNIRYEFDKNKIHAAVDSHVKSNNPGYICVSDGVILHNVNKDPSYADIVNRSMFSICDSSFVPLYIRWIYGLHYEQYCGSQILMDIVSSGKYRMAFLGASQPILDGLKKTLSTYNPAVESMLFYSLPFVGVDDFDYPAIAEMIEHDGADIIWVSLGAPKQEIFMNRLQPYLKHGVMIAVGAAFNFYSGGVGERRAPEWMIRMHMEFLYRIMKSPRKQLKRCWGIVSTLPVLLWKEYRKSKKVKTGNSSKPSC